MSQRRQRFHHYLWHRVRNAWLRLDDSERAAIRQIDPGWVPPRPALGRTRRPLRDNDSGEDFLFMHRRMLARVNTILAQAGDPHYTRVEGWKRLPPPGDSDYPVPEFPDSGLEEVKSDEYFEQYVAPWERQYTDPDYLRGVTLGQLGSDLEFTIHNDLHMRWAAPSPIGYRPNTVVAAEIDAKWDAPAYSYLGDTYSSHVNPIFWKLQGWVDDRIEDWKRAHGIVGEIGWVGDWLGPEAHDRHLDHGPSPHARRGAATPEGEEIWDKLRRIDGVISASGAGEFDGFFRPMLHPRPGARESYG